MGGARRALTGVLALAAGVASAVAVAAGQTGDDQSITIIGAPDVEERSGARTLTINGTTFKSRVITIQGVAAEDGKSATPGEDFDATPQVVTLAGETPREVVTLGLADDELEEPAERFAVEASEDGASLARHESTIVDDDGALDAALCTGMIRPVGRLLVPIAAASIFGGCSPE